MTNLGEWTLSDLRRALDEFRASDPAADGGGKYPDGRGSFLAVASDAVEGELRRIQDEVWTLNVGTEEGRAAYNRLQGKRDVLIRALRLFDAPMRIANAIRRPPE